MEAAEHLKQRIPEIVDAYVKAWRGEYEMTVFHTPNTYSDEKICREFTPFIGQVVGNEKLRQIPPMTGTEDFGYVTHGSPGNVYFLRGRETGQCASPQSADGAG